LCNENDRSLVACTLGTHCQACAGRCCWNIPFHSPDLSRYNFHMFGQLNRAPRVPTFGFVEDMLVAKIRCFLYNVLQRVWSFSASLHTQSKMHALRHVFSFTSVMKFYVLAYIRIAMFRRNICVCLTRTGMQFSIP